MLPVLMALTIASWAIAPMNAFQPTLCWGATNSRASVLRMTEVSQEEPSLSRRELLVRTTATVATSAIASVLPAQPAQAIGPIKVDLLNPEYSAAPCPPSKPIPGEKAMKGMRGLCVTVKVDLAHPVEKDLEKVGVYGFVTDAVSGESVLANNPDLNTDAGQFAIIPSITTKDKQTEFEFVAAIPMEIDVSGFDRGINPLAFDSLRIVSFPGGQQYGEISPCEMNEFSDECEAWEDVNGPYEKGKYMMRSNDRTKGR